MPDITLRDIITKDVFTLKPYDKISDMLHTMSKKQFSCSIIVDDENFPVGIFTQKDAIKLISSKVNFNTTNIDKVMSSPVLSASQSLGFFEAYELIYAKGIRHLVAIDEEGKLSGLATEYDFLSHIGLDFFVVNKMAIDIAKTDFATLTVEHTLSDVLKTLENTKSTSLILLENKRPKAIISEKEILDFANAKTPLHVKLSSLHFKQLLHTTTNATLQDVIMQMHENSATDMAVNDLSGEFYGVIHRHDIMTSLHGKAVDFLLKTLNKKEFTISKLEAQKKELDIFMAAFTSSIIAIVITNKDAVIEWANPAFTALTGYEVAFALGKKPSELIGAHVQSKEFYDAMWQSIGQGKVWKGVVTNKHKSGTLYLEELTITPIFNLQKEITHFIGFKEDITQKEHLKNALMQSEQRFRELFEQAPLPYQSLDMQGNILDVNNKWTELTGYSAQEVKGKFIGDFLVEESLKELSIAFTKFIHHGFVERQAFTLIHKNKNQIHVEVNGSLVYDEAAQPLSTHCILFNVSERNAIKQERREVESVFDNTYEGIIITDKNQNITRVNKAFVTLTGYTQEDVLGKNPFFLKSGNHTKEFYARMWQKIASEGYWHGEIWNRKKNGEIFPELLSINKVDDAFGETVNYIGVFSDITQQKLSEQQFEHLAHHDALTQLPNRLLLLSSLANSIKEYKRNRSITALLLLDLDRFKNVNDSYGHLIGDELLQKIALRLSSRLRDVDLISRLGGDEFAILLPNIQTIEDAGRVALQIITLLTEPWTLSQDIKLQIGVSIGISIISAEISSSQEMLQYADVALYQAKAKGGNNFVYYINEMTIHAREKLELENNLRRAIANHELEIYLQPQIHIQTKKLIGAEALIRWIDPEKGIIYPDSFIPIAEESGLIKAIGSFVLQEACRILAEWKKQEQRAISLSINVSALQLQSQDFVNEVRNAILNFNINPKYLELELTESAIMTNSDESLTILHALRSLGVKLVIDDFGTGYSSFSYLKKFPLDTLKVDKSFINDIPYDKDDMAITQAIIEMGHILNFQIVAEGVETQEQLEFLQTVKCDIFQGYLESKPISVSEFEKIYMAM